MDESSLAKKMKLKPGFRTAVIGAPPGYLSKLQPLPHDVTIEEELSGSFD